MGWLWDWFQSRDHPVNSTGVEAEPAAVAASLMQTSLTPLQVANSNQSSEPTVRRGTASWIDAQSEPVEHLLPGELCLPEV